MNAIIENLTKLSVKALVQISVKEGRDFDNDKAKQFLMNNLPGRAQGIIAEAQKDYEEAKSAFLGGETMAKKCFEVSITHSCTMLAKETFEHSKI